MLLFLTVTHGFASRSIEDGSHVYINNCVKKSEIEVQSDGTKDEVLLSLCPADMPQEFLICVRMVYDARCRRHVFQGDVDNADPYT